MRKRIGIVTVLAAAGALAASAVFGYSGTLVWDPTQQQLVATSLWANNMTTLTWEVNQVGSLFRYEYVLKVPEKNISHFIIETSGNIVQGLDMFAFALSGGAGNPVNPDNYTSHNGNPNMPEGGMYGVKFDSVTGSTQWTIAFTSTRAPVWGDFYAKCGSTQGEVNTLFNTGFTGGLFNSTDFVTRDGTITDNKVAVPDTVGTAVPEMSSVMGGLLGLPAMIGYALKRRRQTK